MINLDWNKKKFVTHIEEEESYPDHYLKCEKLINGTWVNTGWAPNLKGVKQHATAVGGTVRATNNDLAVVFETEEVLDISPVLCDITCPEHS